MEQNSEPQRAGNEAAEHIRVLIIDDHPVVRMGLGDMIRKEDGFEVVGTASQAAEALEIAKMQPIDVLLSDLRMPGLSGSAMISEFHKVQPNTKIVMLTTYHSDEDIFSSVKAGAAAYLLKSASMEKIFEAIRVVHRGQTYFSPEVAKQLSQKLSRTPLTNREIEVLELAAKGLRNREIGKKLFISEHTVRNHLISLNEKMGTASRTEAVAAAVQQGLVRLRSDD